MFVTVLASFGVGVTYLIGRGSWPELAIDVLTTLFLLIGIILVQCGISGATRTYQDMEFEDETEQKLGFVISASPWLLQFALVLLLVFTLIF